MQNLADFMNKLAIMLPDMISGFGVTLTIFFLTLVFSLPLGLLFAFGRMSKNRLIRTLNKAYISIMRGTPLMLQLVVVYFAPFYVFGIKITYFPVNLICVDVLAPFLSLLSF